jgi:hypothetical protein
MSEQSFPLQCCIYASLQRTMLLTLHSHCSTSGMSTGRILSRSRRAGVMRPATTASRSPDTSGQKVNVSHLSRSYAVFKPSQGCQCSPQTSPTHTFSLKQSLLQQFKEHCSNKCSLDWKKGLEVTESTDKQSGEKFPL